MPYALQMDAVEDHAVRQRHDVFFLH
jgi:hypothetical protein